MLPLPRGAVWLLLFLFCAALYINGVQADGRVVCYYTNWSVYRPGTAKFNPQNINPYLCTHLIYAFGGFTKDNQMKPFDKYQDIEQGGYAKFTGLKTYNKQLKTMIAIGGWNEASSRFSPLVANPERRQKFIKNILKFLRQNHFDGIDLDWEYPAHREGGKPRDRDNYAQFVQELRAEFERESEKTGRPRLLLTMAVPAGIEYIEKGYDIPKLNKYLDWFNVLTYDFHSSHEPSVNHHAPLYSLEEESEYNYDAELNIDYSIKFYLNAGADRDKLVLGIPTYGRSYTLINEESTEIGAPAEGPGEQGDATREKGYLAYYEICQNIKEDPEWTVVQPNPNAMGPYAYRRNQWVGYDDEAIVRKKAQYVVENGLGGIMFWAIDNDDFRGTCTGKPYPLIEAAKEAMLDSLGLGINEVSKPSAPQKPSRSRSRENSSSTRNRITTTEHKLTYAERKGGSKRTQQTQQTTRKQQSTTTAAPTTFKLTEAEGSSLYIGGRTTTPPPPTTPDPGTDFKCEEEGFFQHPRDCKKYYWCLDSGPSGLGIVAHQFTCPSGLYFNPAADSCDFARNVPCKTKKSTTAAPVTSTTTTTARPTSSYNRITAATSRPTTFFRTTPRTTTTTTTLAPEEEEYEDEEDNLPSPFAKNKSHHDKDSEEDPKVIKELIELIRKVGGVEELEKHLLRKDDGTISIKESSSSSSTSQTATTPSSISKSLYEKVLSKPNALNSFRNRFTSTSSFRTTKTQIKTQEQSETDSEESQEGDSKSSGATSGFSKYSSVLRSNSRQGPQSEGIDKLSEFDGFQKEKKQYITINRNRGTKKTDELEEEEVAGKLSSESHVEETEEEAEKSSVKSTRRPLSASTPAYSTIRRTRPSTTTETTQDEEEEQQEEKEVTERKTYSSLNRSRIRGTTTTELPEVTEVTAGSSRYKYLERTRPTRPTTESSNKVSDEDDDDIESENQENTVHFKAVKNIESTRETQQQQEITKNTQRTYASIGRRTTTSSTTATPETETTSAAKTTTTATPTTSTTETPLTTTTPLTILETTTPESILLTTIIPITTTTNPITTTSSTTTTKTTTTTSLTNDEDVLENLATTTTNPNDISSDISETLLISQNINSLLTESSSSIYSTPSPTTESGLDTNDSQLTTTTETTSTSTAINDSDNLTKTEDTEHEEEVNLVSKQTNKTLYNTRTRITTTTTPPTTTTTTTNSDIETTNAKKTLGVRRQQILLNRSSQKTVSTSTDTAPTTTATESVNNDFLGTVSSPRPFGFPKRRIRPTSETNTEEVENSNDETIITRQKTTTTTATTKLSAAANNKFKVSSQNTILSQTGSNDEVETSSQQQHVLEQKESEVTNQTEHFNSKDTKVEHFKQHVVEQVDGIEVNTDSSLRHDINNNNVDSSNNNNSALRIRTHTVVHEVDDDDEEPKKLFTWRDARQPTKPTPKQKKLIVTEVTTEERVRQKVSPDHVTIVNVVESDEKDSKKESDLVRETGKYRGKSLEESLENVEHEENHVDSEDEGRAFRTYTNINRRRQQQTQQTTGIGENENAVTSLKTTQIVKSGEEEREDGLLKANLQYQTITRGQTDKTISEEDESGNTHEHENNKLKYTTITRGSTTKTVNESEESNAKNETEESDAQLKNSTFKYSQITRSQSSHSSDNEGESKDDSVANRYKYSNINRVHESDGNSAGNIQTTTTYQYNKITTVQTGHDGQDSQDSSHEYEDNLNNKFKYTTITRGSTTKHVSGSEENNAKNEDEESNVEGTKSTLKYSQITRGQSSHSADNEEESEDISVASKRKYSNINRAHEIDSNAADNAQTKTTYQYNKITTVQTSHDGSLSSHEHEDNLNNKIKYTTITRGSTTKTGSEESNIKDETDENNTKTTLKYSQITRGQSSQSADNEKESEVGSVANKRKYSNINRVHESEGTSEGDTQTKTTYEYNKITRVQTTNDGQDSSTESGNEKKTYTTISRTRGYGSTTDNIPYKAIVRDNQGVRLTEDELSGFVKSAGDLAARRTYLTISRGGQIIDGENQQDEHSKTESIDSMSLTQIEKSTEDEKDHIEDDVKIQDEKETSTGKFKYQTLTRGQVTKTVTDEEETNSSSQGIADIKSKYSTLNRKSIDEVEEKHKEGESRTVVEEKKAQDGYSKYQTITRGQATKTVTEEKESDSSSQESEDIKTKYSTLNRKSNKEENILIAEGKEEVKEDTLRSDIDEKKSESGNLKYQTIARGQVSETVVEETETTNTAQEGEDKYKTKYSSVIRGSSKEENLEVKEDPATTTTTEKPATTTLTTTTEEPTTSTEKVVIQETSTEKEEIPESSTEFVAPETTTTTTAEPTTRRSLFKSRGSVESNVQKTEIENDHTTSHEREENRVQTGRRKIVFKNRTTAQTFTSQVNSGAKTTEEINKSTQNQTSFRKRPINGKRPVVSEEIETESKETKLKYDRGSLRNSETDIVDGNLETTTRPTLPRATYRPKDKGDLSSLLALDFAKKYGSNNQQQFGNGKRRRPVDRTKLLGETEEEYASRRRLAGSTSEEITTNSERINDGTRTTVIKKRIFKSKTSGKGISSETSETLEQSEVNNESGLKGDTETLDEGSLEQTLNTDNLAEKQKSKYKFALGSEARKRLGVEGIAQTDESKENTRTRITSVNNQKISSGSQTVNGRRRTIIRKRIQTNRINGNAASLENAQNLKDNKELTGSGHSTSLETSQTSGVNVDINSETLLKISNENQNGVSSNTDKSTLSENLENTENLDTSLENSKASSESTNESDNQSAENDNTSNSNSKYNFKTKQTSFTTRKNTYSSLNRKNSSSATSSDSQNESTESEDSSKTDSDSKSNFKSRQTISTTRTSTYSALNRKNAFNNKRVTGNQSDKNKKQNQQSETETESDSYETVEEISQDELDAFNNKIKSRNNYQSRNSLNNQSSQSSSRTTNLAGRRGNLNRPQKFEEVEILEDGSKRITTTYIESIVVDGKIKTIKRTKTKTIIKQAPEYIYETDDSLTTTTRRPIPRNRGSARFQSSDLSSLLAIDLASKSLRREQNENGRSKSRVKIIRKPAIIKEEEHVEEIEEDLPTRPTRPSVVTQSSRVINRRTRPTKPLRTTTTTTTEAPQIVEEEKEEEELKEKKIISTTRRNFAFKRPSTTTAKPTDANEAKEKIESSTRRSFAFKRPVGGVKTVTSSEHITENEVNTKRVISSERPAGSARTLATTEEITKTTITHNENISGSLNHLKTKSSRVETDEELITTTSEPLTTTTIKIETTTPEPVTPETTTVETVDQESLDVLKTKLANAVQTEIIDALETKNAIQSGVTNGQDLSLPIYHRRKYYQYYKDSPITFITPITIAPETSAETNVDIAKQIHDVFNVSNDHLQPEPESEEVLALKVKEQAEEINSELSNFLLKTPGSN